MKKFLTYVTLIFTLGFIHMNEVHAEIGYTSNKSVVIKNEIAENHMNLEKHYEVLKRQAEILGIETE